MKTYKFILKSVWFEKEKILVISDLHLGYEQGLQQRGVFLPKFQYKKIIEDLDKIFEEINFGKKNLVNKKTTNTIRGVIGKGGIINKKEKTHYKNVKGLAINNKKEKIKEIIILGDLKHEFSQALQQEWKEVLDLIDYLKKKAGKIILVRGNHDNYLINVVKNKGVKLVDFYIKKIGEEKICFMHGHKLFPECLNKRVKSWFLGHMHPAISIAKGVKKEIYKCFLGGKWRGKEIIILPSFFPLIEGADVNIEETNLGLKLDLRNFEVYVVGDKVYDFGKLRDVGRLV